MQSLYFAAHISSSKCFAVIFAGGENIVVDFQSGVDDFFDRCAVCADDDGGLAGSVELFHRVFNAGDDYIAKPVGVVVVV